MQTRVVSVSRKNTADPRISLLFFAVEYNNVLSLNNLMEETIASNYARCSCKKHFDASLAIGIIIIHSGLVEARKINETPVLDEHIRS